MYRIREKLSIIRKKYSFFYVPFLRTLKSSKKSQSTCPCIPGMFQTAWLPVRLTALFLLLRNAERSQAQEKGRRKEYVRGTAYMRRLRKPHVA